jgi:hypothetical protein
VVFPKSRTSHAALNAVKSGLEQEILAYQNRIMKQNFMLFASNQLQKIMTFAAKKMFAAGVRNGKLAWRCLTELKHIDHCFLRLLFMQG